MKAMILAAGRGDRMMPLTKHLPKPLLKVGGITLIERHLYALGQAGFKEVVVNVFYLGHLIKAHLQDGGRYGVKILWSQEPVELDTGGGIKNALPLLGDAPFFLVNADVLTTMDYAMVLQTTLPPSVWAHLYLVDNPEHHLEGDFSLNNAIVAPKASTNKTYTFTGLSILSPQILKQHQSTCFGLLEAFQNPLKAQKIQGSVVPKETWQDVGTVERLQAANALLEKT